MKNHSEENLMQDAQSSQETAKKQGLEVAVSSQPNSLQEKLGVLGDAISHDAPVTDANLSDLQSAVEGMKVKVGDKEVVLKDAGNLTVINKFLVEVMIGWDIAEENLPEFKFEFIDPKQIDYYQRSKNPDQSKFGQYTVNPEILGMDFEKAKVFIPDLSSFVGDKLYYVFKDIARIYGDKYYIPGIEYWAWLLQNPDKAEKVAEEQKYDIKDGRFYHFPGSVINRHDGSWAVPYCYYHDWMFHRRSREVDNYLRQDDRIILLER